MNGLKTKLSEFLEKYNLNEVLEYYNSGEPITIKYSELNKFSPELIDVLDTEPKKFLETYRECVCEYEAPVIQEQSPRIRVEKDMDKRLISELRSDEINDLVTVEGVVKKVSKVNPRIDQATFECVACGTETEIKVTNKLEKPYCSNEGCDKKQTQELKKEESQYVDYQVLMLQERHKDIEGSEPQDIKVELKGSLCGSVNAGDEVRVIGILDSERRSKKSPIFDKYIEANNVVKVHREFSDVTITEQEKEKIKELSNDSNVFSKITKSIAPSIEGLNHVKQGIALQLFGGVRKDLEDGNRIRGDIHSLLVGEPMTGKSQLLEYVGELAPKGRYASGKGSSEAGLTAAAVRDDFTNDKFTLEAGVLPLSDGGVAAIDELDKMDKKDRRSMHQAMEQQRIHINKAGINTTLSTECSIIAGANPKHGRFDDFTEIREEIDLDQTLLSRFDLVYVIKDEVNTERDKKISDRILKNHKKKDLLGDDLISQNLLRKYISFGREIKPSLSDEAMDVIQNHYLELRDKSHREGENEVVSVGARQLEALIRLSEASARARLSEEVTETDAERAISVLMGSLMEFAYDSETGGFEIDRLVASETKSQRDKVEVITNYLSKYQDSGDEKGVEEKEVVNDLVSEGFGDKKEVNDFIRRLREAGDVYYVRGNRLHLV